VSGSEPSSTSWFNCSAAAASAAASSSSAAPAVARRGVIFWSFCICSYWSGVTPRSAKALVLSSLLVTDSAAKMCARPYAAVDVGSTWCIGVEGHTQRHA